jgi:hypothetical protein
MSEVESKASKVRATVYAMVTTDIELGDDEACSEVCERSVDIYLHGPANDQNAWGNKEDLGASKYVIATEKENEMAFVSKGFLLALIDTAKRASDLDSVYDDNNSTSFSWNDLSKLVVGLDTTNL